MAQFLKGTRYLILVPIIGLALASALVFVLGGIGLIRLSIEVVLQYIGMSHAAPQGNNEIVVHIVEYVHTFLIGTVLYITAVGLYQLFINDIEFGGWLRIESTEDLETALVGVTVVVLAVNFMGAFFSRTAQELLLYGAGIALPIAALGLFIGLRAWAAKNTKHESHRPVSRDPMQPD